MTSVSFQVDPGYSFKKNTFFLKKQSPRIERNPKRYENNININLYNHRIFYDDYYICIYIYIYILDG